MKIIIKDDKKEKHESISINVVEESLDYSIYMGGYGQTLDEAIDDFGKILEDYIERLKHIDLDKLRDVRLESKIILDIGKQEK